MKQRGSNMIKKRKGAVCFHIFAVILAFIMLYPLLWMFSSSLKPTEQIFVDAANLIPKEIRFENYINGWKGMGGISFGTFFKNSFIVAVFATIGSVISSSIVAYGFSRIKFKYKNFWFAVMMGTMMLPEQVLIVPQYILFKKINWTNTFLPLIVPFFCAMPFFVFLNVKFLRGLPSELDEAAEIDGCGRIRIYTDILLPLTKSALVTSVIFSFYWRWQDFLAPLIFLSTPQKYTFSVAIKMFTDPTVQSDWGAMFAMAVLSLIPVCLLFFFFQKYLVEGVATSGLKG